MFEFCVVKTILCFLKINVSLESWKPANTKIRIQPDPTLDQAGSGSTPDPEMLDPDGSGSAPDPLNPPDIRPDLDLDPVHPYYGLISLHVVLPMPVSVRSSTKSPSKLIGDFWTVKK